MTRNRFQFEQKPKNGKELRVIIVARISTEKQNEKSLEDQVAFSCEGLRAITDVPFSYHILQSQDSGEALDRDELFELDELVRSGEWDIVICEDLGRICRRVRAVQICELCIDFDTRLVAPNDNVDTFEDNWRQNAMWAVMRHEQYNTDTARRIRRTQRNRFRNGGILPKQIFGYLRTPDTKTDEQLQIDPSAVSIAEEMFRRLEDEASFESIADWLNEVGIPTGPACKKREWDGTMVGRFVRNDLIKGLRSRNKQKARRNNESGRRRSVPAPPEDLLERNCAHLQLIDPAYCDHVLKLVKDRNAGKGRPKSDGPSARSGIPRKRTTFPAQHARCGICGRPMHKTCPSAGRQQITCSGGFDYRCWNSIYVDIPLTQSKITAAILGEIQGLEGFAIAFPQQLEHAVRQQALNLESDRPKLERKIDELNRKIKNVTSAIAEFGFSPELNDELKSHVGDRDEAKYQLSKLKQQRPTAIRIPTLDEIVGLLKEQLQLAMNEDDEAQRLLCRALPDIFIRPVELCDLRCVQPQAVLTLDLQPLAERLIGHSIAAGVSKTQLVVNLFEECSYVKHAEFLGTAEQRGQLITEAGAQVGLTLGEIGAARKLYRIMSSRNLSNPWLPLIEPPTRGWKGKRHLHPRYRFEPLPGFESPKVA